MCLNQPWKERGKGTINDRAPEVLSAITPLDAQ